MLRSYCCFCVDVGVRRTTRYGVIAARRVDSGTVQLAQRSVSLYRVEAALVIAVVAVEMLARGFVFRRVEATTARVIARVGLGAYAERMSLGIAQIQPRLLDPGTTLDERISRLLLPSTAIEECARILLARCECIGLDPLNPLSWPRDAWRSLGHAYNGDAGYGDVLAAAYAELTNSTGRSRQRVA